MNATLDQLVGLIKEVEDLKVRVNDLEKENKKPTEAADSTEEEIAGLKSTVANACLSLNENMQDLVSLQKDIRQLKRRNIKLEAYTRRESTKIFNVPEKGGESIDETEDVVRTMLHKKMKIPKDDVVSIRFERNHLMPTRFSKQQSPDKPRPIMAKFSFYQGKEFVWSYVKNLKGTRIGICNDFPKEVDEIHTKLYPVLKRAKQNGQYAFFKLDKLIINRQIYVQRGRD